jgi:hypothetical protein
MYHEIRVLLALAGKGARFDALLTVGHQNLFLHDRDVRRLEGEFDLSKSAVGATRPFGRFADEFLEIALGVRSLTMLDVSDYEGAGLIHDLNCPTPKSLDESFDAVVDGGSLEHVFNVPVALASLMRMTKVGGHLCLAVPANNLCGHGFYQFSPEFMYRALDGKHGFRLEDAWIAPSRFPSVELLPARGAFRVMDPARVGGRIGLVSRQPAMLVVAAEKVRHSSDPFAAAPHQSDYVKQWAQRLPHVQMSDTRRVLRLPSRLRLTLRGYRQRRAFSLRNPRFYEKADR